MQNSSKLKILRSRKIGILIGCLVGLAALAAVSPLPGVIVEHLHETAFAATDKIGVTEVKGLRPVEELSLVRTITLGPAEAPHVFVYAGEVRGRYESVLAFQAGGRIIKRHVQLGDVVQAGDVLMEIDPKDIKESLALTSAQVQSASAQLRLAEVNLGRYQRLYGQGAVAKVQLDQQQTAYDASLAALDQARALQAQSANMLEYSLLRADKAGVIAGVSAEMGQVIAPGIPVVTLVHDGDREIEISVPENRIASLSGAESLQISFWALPGVQLGGEVRETAPMADPVLRTYKARIRLLDTPAEIRLGMTASVRVEETGEVASTRLIPLSAVYQDTDSSNVWVVREGTLELRDVQLGDFSDEGVRVLNGLADGETIVTAGIHKLMPGQRVRTATGGNS